MIHQLFQGKRVLITGHSGFKGSWLSLFLLELGASVYGISEDIPTSPSLFELANLNKQVKSVWTDINNFSAIKKEIQRIKPDFIFHAAAQPITSVGYSDPLKTFQTNIMGTVHILEVLKHLQKECVAILITSDKCYENKEWVWGYREIDMLGGKDPYSASKAAAELVIRSYYESFFRQTDGRIKILSVRAGNIIGGGDWSTHRLIPDCIRHWQQNKPVPIRNPRAIRPWQHVLDAIYGYLLAAYRLHEKPELNGEAYNFGPPAEAALSVLEVVKAFSAYFKLPDLTYQTITSSEFKEASTLKLNSDKAHAHLGWKAQLNISDTLKLTAQWYKSFLSGNKNMRAFTQNQIRNFLREAQ